MGDRDGEALACLLDEMLLEPVGAARRMGGDDDLVRAEGAERVLHRLERLRVADFAAGLDPVGAEPGEARVDAVLRRQARLVLVGSPVLQPRVQRGRDEQYLGAALPGLLDAV